MKRLVMISIDGCKICNKYRPIAKQNCDVKGIDFVEYNAADPKSESYDIEGIPMFILEVNGVVEGGEAGESGLINLGIIPPKW